jgi:hypothetical protein
MSAGSPSAVAQDIEQPARAAKVDRQFPGSKRLPSVEAQTLAYFEEARASERLPMPRWLAFAGFKVYLRYWRKRALVDGTVLGELLVIASVTIPERCQQRGWFWRYCQLCAALAADGVVLECVHNLELLEAVRRHPAFREVGERDFLLQKAQPRDWPLAIK